MNRSRVVAAEVTRRTEAGVHIFPPRYLGGYVPVHGEPIYYSLAAGSIVPQFSGAQILKCSRGGLLKRRSQEARIFP